MSINRKIISILLLFLISFTLMAEKYKENSGDKALDDSLVLINKTINSKSKQNKFVDKLADKFQIPEENVAKLFEHYKFTPADVVMSVSTADVSGEPLNIVSGLYFKNRHKGWKYTLKQLNIDPGSKVYEQIKKDMSDKY